MKRLLNTILLFLFISSITNAQTMEFKHSFRVMSFNIRYDNPHDGEHAWPNRREKVVSVIRYHKSELFGVQEALKHQVHELQYYFPKYKWFGVGRDNGNDQGEYAAIFYDSTRFEFIDGGNFWLSDTPDIIGSKGWDAALPRIATWVKLKDLETKTEFYFFNTHFDHQGTIARIESAKLITRKISEIAGDNPVILGGDFNSFDYAGPYQQIVFWDNPDRLEDCYKLATYGHLGPTTTYISFEPQFEEGHRIDFLFVKGKVRVLHHVIIADHWDGFYPSDHLPILAEITFE